MYNIYEPFVKTKQKFNQTVFHSLKIFFIESGTSQLVVYVQVKCPIRRPILHIFNSHVDTTKIMFSTDRKPVVCYLFLARIKVISYSLLIPYSLFLISFDGFQLNLENTSIIENVSSLLIFNVRGQRHGDILSFNIQPSGHN